MRHFNFKILLSLTMLIFSTTAFSQEITTKAVIDLTEKAVALIQDKGGAALEIIGKTGGDFHKESLYVFVYDTDVNIIAHPAKPSLVGKNYKGKPDVKGNKFRDSIVEEALNGGGWTEYFYQKPDQPGLFKKKVFSKLAEKEGKKYIIACGMYAKKL